MKIEGSKLRIWGLEFIGLRGEGSGIRAQDSVTLRAQGPRFGA
jgi:hypothetical protein